MVSVDVYDALRKNRFNLYIDTIAWRPYTSWPWWYIHHLVFLISCSTMSQSFLSLQKELVDTGWFIPFPAEYLHITLKAVKSYMKKEDTLDDSMKYSQAFVSSDSPILPFDIHFKWVNFFNNVVFVQCFDTWILELLHKKIISHYGLPINSKRDLENYVPHIAIWTYIDSQCIDKIYAIGQKYRTFYFWSLHVDSYQFCDVVRSGITQFPSIDFIKKFDL